MPSWPRSRLVLVGAGLAGIVALGFGLAQSRLPLSGVRPTGLRGPRPNVLLVTIDTLRADALGCYGRPDAGTPTLDALARRGVRFETAVAPVPLTSPSHASILTALIPVRHGVRDNGGYVLPDGVASVQDVFHDAGYRTGGFVSGFPLVRRFRFARGFDDFDDRLPHGNDPHRAPYVERTADQTTDAVLGWLQTRLASSARQPFFAWVHYYDPHAPYEPPAPFHQRFAARPYQGEVAFVDEQFGRLLDGLGRLGFSDNTIVLVTADHGESLGEHGEATHGIFVYDSTVRIPWIMAGPGLPAGLVARATARAIDIAPTLLDLAGLPPLGDVDGRSRRPLPGRELPDEPAYVESLSPLLHLGWAPLHAWRSRRFKLIDAPTPELYDLQADPAERHNVARAHPEIVADLRRPLAAALAHRPSSARQAVDRETSERLAALGYLPSGSSAAEPASGSAIDAKDHTALLARLERALSRFRIDPGAAIADLTAVLDENPAVVIARRYRAIAFAGNRRPEKALADLSEIEKAGALTADDLVTRADSLAALGRSEEAFTALEQAQAAQPSSPRPALSKARLLARLGRDQEAAAALEHALSVAPGDGEALCALGDLAAFQGDLPAASARYEQALALDPEDARLATKLATVRIRQQRFTDAVGLLERALSAAAPTTAALNALGQARAALGDVAGAREALGRSLALEPAQPEIARTRDRLADRDR